MAPERNNQHLRSQERVAYPHPPPSVCRTHAGAPVLRYHSSQVAESLYVANANTSHNSVFSIPIPTGRHCNVGSAHMRTCRRNRHAARERATRDSRRCTGDVNQKRHLLTLVSLSSDLPGRASPVAFWQIIITETYFTTTLRTPQPVRVRVLVCRRVRWWVYFKI